MHIRMEIVQNIRTRKLRSTGGISTGAGRGGTRSQPAAMTIAIAAGRISRTAGLKSQRMGKLTSCTRTREGLAGTSRMKAMTILTAMDLPLPCTSKAMEMDGQIVMQATTGLTTGASNMDTGRHTKTGTPIQTAARRAHWAAAPPARLQRRACTQDSDRGMRGGGGGGRGG